MPHATPALWCNVIGCCSSRDVNTVNMDVLAVFRLGWFGAVLSVGFGSGNNVEHDEVETYSFDVKPGAGRQEFVRNAVCHLLDLASLSYSCRSQNVYSCFALNLLECYHPPTRTENKGLLALFSVHHGRWVDLLLD